MRSQHGSTARPLQRNLANRPVLALAIGRAFRGRQRSGGADAVDKFSFERDGHALSPALRPSPAGPRVDRTRKAQIGCRSPARAPDVVPLALTLKRIIDCS